MHTVPKTYLAAFTLDSGSGPDGNLITCFDKDIPGKSRITGIRNTEVVKDIYAVLDENGARDTGVETILSKWEGRFTTAMGPLLTWRAQKADIPINKEQWLSLSRFIAAQMFRTPKALSVMIAVFKRNNLPYKSDSPPRVMLDIIARWARRLTRMTGSLVYTDTDLPLITSDNPVVTWNRKDMSMTPGGVDQLHPDLAISCPLTPHVFFLAEQTPSSLAAAHAEANGEKNVAMYRSALRFGTAETKQVKELNLLCLRAAHKRVYANYCDPALLRFLEKRFWVRG